MQSAFVLAFLISDYFDDVNVAVRLESQSYIKCFNLNLSSRNKQVLAKLDNS